MLSFVKGVSSILTIGCFKSVLVIMPDIWYAEYKVVLIIPIFIYKRQNNGTKSNCRMFLFLILLPVQTLLFKFVSVPCTLVFYSSHTKYIAYPIAMNFIHITETLVPCYCVLCFEFSLFIIFCSSTMSSFQSQLEWKNMVIPNTIGHAITFSKIILYMYFVQHN